MFSTFCSFPHIFKFLLQKPFAPRPTSFLLQYTHLSSHEFSCVILHHNS